MTHKKWLFILALALPILALLAWTMLLTSERASGQRVQLEIFGYDPFHLLQGHYLIYRVNYNVPGVCRPRVEQGERLTTPKRNTGYVCLQPKQFSYQRPDPNCQIYIRGVCHNSRFVAGIEKYFIPEEHAKALEKSVRDKQAKIEISVTKRGQAYVTDLLIEGKSWKQQLN